MDFPTMSTSTPSVETILEQAIAIAAPEERQAFVERACAGDAGLRQRVERLITNHFRAGGFLERPAVEVETIIVPDAVIGPYKLLEPIGEGAWASSTSPSRSCPCAARLLSR
jgi:hypothetical protein